MRTLLPTFTFALLAAPAFAGSIATMPAASSSGSISTVRCEHCPALKEKASASTYHVDPIAPGTQKVEIREENGERKIYRTEAWMGGSPVLFVNKAPEIAVESAKTDKPLDENAAAEAVDASAKTGALDTGEAKDATVTTAATSREFDPAKFELRVE